MNQQTEPKGFFMTPLQIFVAYAEKRANEEALPKTQGYYEKRWRLIAGLFGIPFDLGSDHGLYKEGAFRLLEALLDCRRRATRLVPDPIMERGQWPILDQENYFAYQRSLSKKEKAIQHEYDQMGGDLFEAIFPVIGEKHVSMSRLFELGLPPNPPDPQQEECDWIQEHWDDVGLEEPTAEKAKDEISQKEIDFLKLAEEEHLRAERKISNQMNQIRLQVMGLGLATIENVDEVIYNMPVKQYLDLAGDFPKLSRVHFQPTCPPRPEENYWPENLPLPHYHERSLIISPLVYLMEELRYQHSWTIFTTPRLIVGGWVLRLLPEELHAEASRRVPHPIFDKIHGVHSEGVYPSDTFKSRIKWITVFEMNKVRLRVIEMGLASNHDVDAVIYDMPLDVFRDVARGYSVSRVDFRPKSD
jgi:hypothetical protein